jgi:hypothetical protein
MVCLGAVLVLGLGSARADVYKCPDGQGGTRYQDAPCRGDTLQPILQTEEPPAPSKDPRRSAAPRPAPAAGASRLEAEREARQQARQDAIRRLQLEEVREETTATGRYLSLRGKVRNDGRQRVERIAVRVEWQDSAGKVLDTSFLTIVGKDGLEPGQAKSWRVAAPRDRRVTQYNVYIPMD